MDSQSQEPGAQVRAIPVGQYMLLGILSCLLLGLAAFGLAAAHFVSPTAAQTAVMPTPIPVEVQEGTNVTTEMDFNNVEPVWGVTATFEEVTSAGELYAYATDTAPELSEGYLQLGNLFYDISTTAIFTSATICFSYDPTTVDGSTLSLLHHDGTAWIDVTTSNDTVNGYICGTVTSLSPFALAHQTSVTTIVGFHPPVDMTPGLVNTVKDGSAVPLKFNVYQDDVEVTDPAVVAVSIVEVACSGGAADPVDSVLETEAGTGLTYSGTAGVDGQFIQVWKTPKVAVITCYQVTATVSGGPSITALFQLNP